jgi:hypothetical protein
MVLAWVTSAVPFRLLLPRTGRARGRTDQIAFARWFVLP